MRRIINNKKSNNNNDDDNNNNINIRGSRTRKSVVSFQIDDKVWREFDKEVEEEYGRYKKSLIIENLIRQYMKKKKSSNNNNNNKEDLI